MQIRVNSLPIHKTAKTVLKIVRKLYENNEKPGALDKYSTDKFQKAITNHIHIA